MAKMIKEILGEMLATENLSFENKLPSPDQLKNKIILKGKPKLLKKKTKTRRFGNRKSSSEVPQQALGRNSIYEDDGKDTLVEDGEEPNIEDDIENVEVPLEQSMGQLIVYCRAVPYKREEVRWNCCEMHSFNENHASELISRFPKDMIELSSNKLLRTYPKGTRVESSNYNPMPMWKVGIQMAAINTQKPDIGLYVNEGFFRKSNGSGYVLKPKCFTEMSASDLDKKILLGRSKQKLSIELLSGQFINKGVFLGLPVQVEIEMIGIEKDCNSFVTEPCMNVMSPQWKYDKAEFEMVIPSMCVLFFKVFASARVNKLIYQNCLPVECLRPGVRYIPMQTITCVPREENGIFVKISKEDVSHSSDEIFVENSHRRARSKSHVIKHNNQRSRVRRPTL